MTICIVKHLRDLRSGKPETDVEAFTSEDDARLFISEQFVRHGFMPWRTSDQAGEPVEKREPVFTWFIGSDVLPDEYVELDLAQLHTEWKPSECFPDIEERTTDVYPLMVDEGGDIDDQPSDGASEWPEGSGG